VTWTDPGVSEIAVGLIWIVGAIGIAHFGAHQAAFLFLLSGMCYPTLYLVGFRIEWLGWMPIAAEVFAISGLLLLGGGSFGPLVRDHLHSWRGSGSVPGSACVAMDSPLPKAHRE